MFKTHIAIAIALCAATSAHAQLSTWSVRAAKTTPVTRTAGGGVNGILYAVGGVTGANTTTANVEGYDPALDQWSLATTAPLALCDEAVAASKSKLYVAGGRTTPTGAPTTAVNSYEPATLTWSARAPLPTARFGACAAFESSTLYVIGGDTGGGVSNLVETYSTATNSWSAAAVLPTARRGAACVTTGTLLIVVGGDTGSGALNVVEAYDYATKAWVAKAPLPAARTQAGAVVLNNILYVTGGKDSSGQDTKTLFMYDPTTNQWLSGANAPTAASGAAVGKSNAQLVVAGGSGGAAVTNVYTAGTVQFFVSRSGITQPTDPIGAVFKSFGQPAVNAKGHYAYAGRLVTGPGGVTALTAAGVWADHDSGPARLIAQQAAPAPGTNGAVFASFGDPVFDNNDKVAFIGKLTAGVGDATTLNATGIWSDASGGGTLKLVARLGSPAPETPAGTTFASFISLVLPDSGGAAFVAKLAGATVTTANATGLWADDGNGNLHLVARTGQTILGKTLTTLTVFPVATGVSGQTRGFNINADLVYLAKFSDATRAIVHAVAP